MKVHKLGLVNFRNYSNEVFEFDDHINILIGNNAQGKTNLIEAIYLLSVAKSFRTRINKEMILFDQMFSRIIGKVSINNRLKELQLILSNEGKRAKIDGIEISKTSDFVGELNVVVFTPDDLYLVKGSPSVRRRLIDIELSKMNKIYLYNVNQYHKLLKERNSYLKILNKKNKYSSDDYLDVLSEQMAELQVKIIKERIKFIHQLNKYAKAIYLKITNNQEELQIEYLSNYDYLSHDLYKIILNTYKRNLEKDIRYSKTSNGIHKDDILMKLNDKFASLYASQGQQRSIVLSLKIGLVNLIHQVMGEYPVLLLDDVLSELDEARQKELLHLFHKDIQTFITSTNINVLEPINLVNSKIFYIKEGGQINERRKI